MQNRGGAPIPKGRDGGGCLDGGKLGAPQELKIVQSNCQGGGGAVVGGEGGELGRSI